MDEHSRLRERLAELEGRFAELTEQLALRDRRIAALEAALSAKDEEIAAKDEEIARLKRELQKRGKRYQPKGNSQGKKRKRTDRRQSGQRQHPGSTRPDPPNIEDAIHHDVLVEHCPFCGGQVDPTGEFEDCYSEEIPEPKTEVHRFRRHVCKCRDCQRRLKGRADLDVPGSTVGPRARLLTVYSRAHLGISLGKTVTLLDELFGLKLSRAGALGHLKWFDRLFDPVVQRLLELLRESPVVHADETGWRINGQNVWCWCFCNPKLAVFLIDQHRSSQVVQQALGESIPGILVTDFYAAYGRIAAKKQKCLTHLLRELAKLREELPARAVSQHIQPLIELFQDAIALAGQREALGEQEFELKRAEIRRRFADRWWRQSKVPDCQRIYDRLRKHKDELLLFLDDASVPPENNLAERDIRSVAATRADGGVNRSRWGAHAFAVAKSIVRTCQKAGRNFFGYALDAVEQIQAGHPAPLPIDDTS